jgi:PTS system glucose-specific IIC component
MASFLSNLQRVGQAFMLPVAVLPVAGLFLGLGTADLPFLPHQISEVMAAAGGSIFGILPLMFAIATAIAYSKNDGTAGLASVVGYVVFLATMGVVAKMIGMPVGSALGIETVDTGVIGGIAIGAITAICYNRYNGIKLPEFLAFFSGRRFIPIVTSCASLLLGIVFVFIWKPIGGGIEVFSNWAAYQSPLIAFPLYTFVERLLIPMGLHHVWNVPFFFQIGEYVNPVTGQVVHGEIARYLAGDPTAGNLAGSYLFKMYGLPGAALAMIYTAKPENKKVVASIMISAALTSFITGITEPIEFSFLFVAPVLYIIHACLATLGSIIALSLDIHHCATFSQGLVDYIVLYSKSTNGWMLIPLGLAWGVLYFVVFTFAIKVFNLKTPGREEKLEEQKPNTKTTGLDLDMGEKLVVAYGGATNIVNLEACITRLRITVKDVSKVNKDALKALGAKGFMNVGSEMHSIFGTYSDLHRQSMVAYIESK